MMTALRHPASPVRGDWIWNLAIFAGLLFFVIPMSTSVIVAAGDWDFWTDWKDSVFYPLAMPVVAMIALSAAQYTMWRLFRVPGATILALLFTVAYHWPRVFFNFHLVVDYPMNFVWPSVIIPGALLVDVMFLLTRRWVYTALLGGLAFGSLFYVQNFPAIAPFRQPLVEHNKIMTLADLQGAEYVRSATPEYGRIVETGGLRTFPGQTTINSAALAGVLCIVTYAAGHMIGRGLIMWPVGRYLKRVP